MADHPSANSGSLSTDPENVVNVDGLQYQWNGKTYVYTDPSGVEYEFDQETNTWKVINAIYENDVSNEFDDIHSKYEEYLSSLKAENVETESKKKVTKKPKVTQKSSEPVKTVDDKGFFILNYNTSVYVNGLPPDATAAEIAEMFSKCGVIKKNEETGDLKIKIYRNGNGECKGDAMVAYIKRESVELAETILDGADFRPGSNLILTVSEAKFEAKDGQVLKNKNNRKKKKKKKKIFQWGFDDEHVAQRTKPVILKNVFSFEDYKNPHFLDELRSDLTEECQKLGEMKLRIFDTNPEGIVEVRYKDAEAAERCIELMNGRYFGGRVLAAEYYDGVTNYKVEESEELKAIRQKTWDEFLGGSGSETE